MALTYQIKGQPGKHEIRPVIPEEKPCEGAPRRSLLQDLGNAWACLCLHGHHGMLSWHPPEPRQQPDEADQTEYDKKWPPTESRHQHATHEHAECRPAGKPGSNDCVRTASLLFREISCQDL